MSTPRPFRLGIVGCGLIAVRHVRACLRSPETELTALVDAHEDRAQALAERFRLQPRVVASVDDAFSDVDGVVIAVPNHLHAEVAVKCLRAGVPVLIEKPLATTVADGEAIHAAALEAGAVAAVAYMSRFRANVELLGDLIARRYFGRVRRFAYQAGSRGGWSPLSAYNLDRRAAGGGVLVVTGTHFLDRMLAWFGYPSELSLEDDSHGGPEANAVARFGFAADGHTIEGVARFSKSLSLPAGLVMETETGLVRLDEQADAGVRWRAADLPGVESVLRATGRRDHADDGFLPQLEDFVRAVREGGTPRVATEQGLASLRLIEALYAARTPMDDDWYAVDAVTEAAR